MDGLLAALEGADADAASVYVTALLRMRRASSLAAIASALGSDNVHARRAAAVALASAGTKQGRDALARAMATDPDPEVRRISASALRPA